MELIAGELFDMSPIESLHAAVVSRLARDFIVAIGAAVVVLFRDPHGSGYETRRTHRAGDLLHPRRLPACGVDPLAMLREP